MSAPRRSRAFVALVALVASAACATPRVPLAGQCVFNDECAQPLVCAGFYCRAECRDARDCVAGFECTPVPAENKRVCVPAGAPRACAHASDCCAPLVCTADGICRPQYLADYDCDRVQAGGRCIVAQVDGVGYRTCDFHPITTDPRCVATRGDAGAATAVTCTSAVDATVASDAAPLCAAPSR